MNVSIRLSSRLILLMAVGSGMSAASNYFAQPLLDLFVRQFQVTPLKAGLLVTVAQLGYLAGLVLLVPLGDLIERRKILAVTSGLTAVGLIAMGLSTSFNMLIALAAVVGLTSVAAHVLVPMAASLAAPDQRGRAVSSVMSGLLIGILVARTFAGLVAEFAGWRTVYLVAGCFMAVFCVCSFFLLPSIKPTLRSSYAALLLSIARLFREQPTLRQRGLLGMLSFASFAMFWTSLAFMLSQRYGFGEGLIGTFALIGVAGALCARFAGKLADAGWSRVSTGGFIALNVCSWAFLYGGQWSLTSLVLGILLLDLGAQGTHISNQSEIYRLDPAARSRLTTGYMSCYFVGGALGSAMSAAAFGYAQWTGVCVVGVLLSLTALALWAKVEFRLPWRLMQHTT